MIFVTHLVGLLLEYEMSPTEVCFNNLWKLVWYCYVFKDLLLTPKVWLLPSPYEEILKDKEIFMCKPCLSSYM